MSGDVEVPEPESEPEIERPYHGMLTEGLDRAVKLARAVLKERGLSDDEIDRELGKLPDPRPKNQRPT